MRANGFGSHAVLLAVIASTALFARQDLDRSSNHVIVVAARQLAEWLGPVGNNDAPGGLDSSRQRFVVPPGDRSAHREALAQLVRRYWTAIAATPVVSDRLLEGLIQYTAARLIHEMLRDDHRATFRYFGGFVRYVSPHVRLTNPKSDPHPPVLALPDAARAPLEQWSADPSREVRALATLERHLGWPTMQLVLARLAARAASDGITPDALAAAIAEVSGRNLRWFITDAFASAKTYDYAVSRIDVVATGAAFTRSAVIIERHGDAMFADASPSRLPLDHGRHLEVLVRFSDDTTWTESWDGRGASREFVFEGPARVVATTVDPRRILRLDANPFNNALRSDAVDPRVPARWGLQWMAWLQDAVLLVAAVL